MSWSQTQSDGSPAWHQDLLARQRIGGVAALIEAGTFVVSLVMFATALSEYTMDDRTPAKAVAFVVDHQASLFLWQVVTLVLFGVLLVPLVLVLHERLDPKEPSVVRVATVFGLVWAALVVAAGTISIIGIGAVADSRGVDPAGTETAWATIDAVVNGLRSGAEIFGSLWLLLISMAGRRSGLLPRGASWIGAAAGMAGLFTVIPALKDVGAVFGVGLVVWFAWVGSVLLRVGPRPAHRRHPSASGGAVS